MNRPAGHHGSHVQLLDRDPPPAPPCDVDAIVVPTARPVAYLRNALALAMELRCPLVVLCSRQPRVERVAALPMGPGVDLTAVDVTGAPALPPLATGALLSGTPFHRPADTSLKRNLGLALARMVGWRHVVFLDDDVLVAAGDLRTAAGLLAAGGHDAVGLANAGYPDNSVVCHAYRRVGGVQDSFVGGGALAVPALRTTSFFPSIYNEDWFYLLGGPRLAKVAVTGKAVQAPYEPFADPDRARGEEFGDCLAEGVFALLDDGGQIGDAGAGYWRRFLRQREALIQHVLARARADRAMPVAERGRVEAALKAARARLALITPDLCVGYLARWRADRVRWAAFVSGLPEGRELGAALERLRLVGLQPPSRPAASRRSGSSTPDASTATAAAYPGPTDRSAIAAASGEPR